MRKSKTARQKLILENDKLFREIIRARDKVCQRKGFTTNLQVAHFWRRNILRTRWDMDNACLLNAGIHKWWAHANPQDFRVFWLKRLGQERFDKLELRARYAAPVKEFDLICINKNLQETLASLKKE